MASQLDALWNEFAAETEEHLDALERLLSDRTANWSAPEIGALFRYFHSLKGTFLAMGFTHVEAVAHRCEDILSLVREGQALLEPPLVKVLLRAVDRLKGMREEVLATQKDARPATDILGELKKHSRKQEKPSAAPVAAPENIPLGDDPEMLAIYSELLEQRLPSIALALSDVAADRAAAAETAGELAYGAGMMGFDSLAEHLDAVAALALDAQTERAQTVHRLAEIRERAGVIEEITGVTSGAAALAIALAKQLQPDHLASLHALAVAAADLARDEPETAGVLAATNALRTMAAGLGFEKTSRLLILAEEQIRNFDQLGVSQRKAVSDFVRSAADALRPYAEAGTDIDATHADSLASQWEALFRQETANVSLDESVSAGLSPQIRATLSPEQRAKLDSAAAEGHRAFELLLDLETHPEIAGDVLAWLSSAVQTITSHTAYGRGAHCFEFLVISEHAADWIHAQLAALDPERACLRGVRELGQVSSAAENAGAASTAPARTPLIRVQSETVDELMAQVGEMRSALANLADVLQHGRIAKALLESRRLDQNSATQGADLHAYRDAMDADLRDLRALESALEGAHRRIWTVGLQLRVIPVDGVFGRLSRAARDLTEKLGKEIDVVMEGREVRIDKSMVDVLIDPLMHMVRNAVDHGIESPDLRRAAGKPAQARLSINASEQGNRINIAIADDGRGLDRSKIADKAVSLGMISPAEAEQMTDQEIFALIFRPGFSTASSVTEVSGRGVGLDVVEATLQRLGGTVELESSLGVGTKFTLRLPVSAALLPTLLVEVAGQVFALPERQVVAVQERANSEIEQAAGQRFIIHRGTTVPVRRLAATLGFPSGEAISDDMTQLVIVTAGTRMLGLSVDRILRFQDLFLKELHPMLAAIPIVAGTSVLGDGRPVLVLDANPLMRLDIAEDSHALH